MPDKNGMWVQPLTPIKCQVCGKDYAESGRYANRSTVCRYCRKRLMKAMKEAQATPSVKYIPSSNEAKAV